MSLKVVISSTVMDLEEHRAVVTQVIRQHGLEPISMEALTARGGVAGEMRPVKDSLELVEKADVYLGILGRRYGYIPPGFGISITEMEYNRAIELGLETLIFVGCGTEVGDLDARESDQVWEKLTQFHARVTTAHTCANFKTPEDLAVQVAVALSDWLKRRPAHALSKTEERPLLAGARHSCDDYARKISEWFSIRFAAFGEMGRRPALMSNDAVAIDADLPQGAECVERVSDRVDFRGGFYVLDEQAVVISQYVPKVTEMPDIRGFRAHEREYWQMIIRERGPIVCNAFRSANRGNDILVMAVPRFDSNGTFLGILDAVIDVPDAPFCDYAAAVGSEYIDRAENEPRLELMLLDANDTVLGSLDDSRQGRSMSAHPVVEALRKLDPTAKSDPFTGYGTMRHIAGTPFSVAAFWVRLP